MINALYKNSMKKINLQHLRIGALTGFIAVIFTTIINLTGRFIGLLPEAMDLKDMAGFFIDQKIHAIGALILGIIIHIIIGVITGTAYLFIVKTVNTGSGIVFMLIFWLFNMLVGMPLSGRGWFGLNDGFIIPISTFILHFIFGVCLHILIFWV